MTKVAKDLGTVRLIDILDHENLAIVYIWRSFSES